MLKIGLTYTGNQEKHNYYVNWLVSKNDREFEKEAGSFPAPHTIEVIKLSVSDHHLKRIQDCDGLVLAGGRDIHPKFYSNVNTDYPYSNGFDEQRDEFEIEMFKKAQENEIPVLGVCRGLQLINCILMGNLNQDIGEGSNKIHRAEESVVVKQMSDKAHPLNIEAGSLIHNIALFKRAVVNSAHHQSINRLGEGLTGNCLSDEGIIEGIEWIDRKGKSFLLGVQWHPERMFQLNLQDSPLSKGIRDLLIDEINKSILKKSGIKTNTL